MAEQEPERIALFTHYLPKGERAGFEFDVGPDKPPVIVIRGGETDEDDEGPFIPLHVYSCLGHEHGDRAAAAALLADTLEEIVGWLRQPLTEESEH